MNQPVNGGPWCKHRPIPTAANFNEGANDAPGKMPQFPPNFPNQKRTNLSHQCCVAAFLFSNNKTKNHHYETRKFSFSCFFISIMRPFVASQLATPLAQPERLFVKQFTAQHCGQEGSGRVREFYEWVCVCVLASCLVECIIKVSHIHVQCPVGADGKQKEGTEQVFFLCHYFSLHFTHLPYRRAVVFKWVCVWVFQTMTRLKQARWEKLHRF